MESLDKIVKEVSKYIASKKRIIMALPGGRSIVPFLEKFKEEKIEWNKIHFFMADERLVKLNDKDSNFRMLSEKFFSELISKGNLSPMNLHPFRVEKGIKEYETDLISMGGKFDIVILGVGEDGHVAGLFPNYTVLDKSKYFIEFHDSPKPPKDRMSSSKNLIEKSEVSVLLFVGESKKEAYGKFMDEKTNWKECPAKIALNSQNLVYTNFF